MKAVYGLELDRAISGFEILVGSIGRFLRASLLQFRDEHSMALTLSELYAMMSALQIRACISAPDRASIETADDNEEIEGQFGVRKRLPELGAVQKAARSLFAAVATRDDAGVSIALEQMGVIDLCPIVPQQFSRMDFVAKRVSGRSQLVPLVELSLLASSLGEYERAGAYVLESRGLDPGSWEAYNLWMVDGLIALDAGAIGEAIQCLAKSISACQTDEHASLECSLRAPNFVLASKLLERGQRVEVLRHLFECRDVWQFLAPQIEEWIDVIEGGGKPDLESAGILTAMNQPFFRLTMGWLRACSLEEGTPEQGPASGVRRSPSAVLQGRDRLREEYRRQMRSGWPRRQE